MRAPSSRRSIALPRRRAIGWWALPWLLVPGAALAQAWSGQITQPEALRAGPDEAFPVVESLAPGEPVSVYGCVEDRYWCDVQTPTGRGWAPGDAIAVTTQGTTVVLDEAPAWFSVPIFAFVQQDYWGRYYRNRPWYGRPPVPPPGGWHRPPPGHGRPGGWSGDHGPRPGGWNNGPWHEPGHHDPSNHRPGLPRTEDHRWDGHPGESRPNAGRDGGPDHRFPGHRPPEAGRPIGRPPVPGTPGAGPGGGGRPPGTFPHASNPGWTPSHRAPGGAPPPAMHAAPASPRPAMPPAPAPHGAPAAHPAPSGHAGHGDHDGH